MVASGRGDDPFLNLPTRMIPCTCDRAQRLAELDRATAGMTDDELRAIATPGSAMERAYNEAIRKYERYAPAAPLPLMPAPGFVTPTVTGLSGDGDEEDEEDEAPGPLWSDNLPPPPPTTAPAGGRGNDPPPPLGMRERRPVITATMTATMTGAPAPAAPASDLPPLIEDDDDATQTRADPWQRYFSQPPPVNTGPWPHHERIPWARATHAPPPTHTEMRGFHYDPPGGGGFGEAVAMFRGLTSHHHHHSSSVIEPKNWKQYLTQPIHRRIGTEKTYAIIENFIDRARRNLMERERTELERVAIFVGGDGGFGGDGGASAKRSIGRYMAKSFFVINGRIIVSVYTEDEFLPDRFNPQLIMVVNGRFCNHAYTTAKSITEPFPRGVQLIEFTIDDNIVPTTSDAPLPQPDDIKAPTLGPIITAVVPNAVEAHHALWTAATHFVPRDDKMTSLVLMYLAIPETNFIDTPNVVIIKFNKGLTEPEFHRAFAPAAVQMFARFTKRTHTTVFVKTLVAFTGIINALRYWLNHSRIGTLKHGFEDGGRYFHLEDGHYRHVRVLLAGEHRGGGAALVIGDLMITEGPMAFYGVIPLPPSVLAVELLVAV